MKKLTALLIITSIFLVGCVTTNNSSYNNYEGGVPIFEVEYFNLIQFDNNGNYDKEATNTALDLFFRNHPAIKTISYDTPLRKTKARNPYHNKNKKDSLLVMDGDEVDREKTGDAISGFSTRYKSITALQLITPSGMPYDANFDSIIDEGKEITFRSIRSALAGAYDYKNPIQTKKFFFEVGETQKVNEPSISKYSFAYYVPTSVTKHDTVKILFAGHGNAHENYRSVTNMVADNIDRRYRELAEEYGYVVVSVVLPQLTQYMDGFSMIPGMIENDFWERPDLEYIKVIDALTESMTTEGFDVHKKVFMTGFSNGGAQSNIFPILHPEYVEATAPGAVSLFTVPSDDFNWPMGIANIDEIEGIEFDVDEYRNVEHFIFGGGDDENDHVKTFDNGVEYKEMYGEHLFDRIPVHADILSDLGLDVEYKVYEGIGHDDSDEMYKDIFEFFESIEIE